MSEIILKSAAEVHLLTQSGAEGACFSRRRNELRQRRIILSGKNHAKLKFKNQNHELEMREVKVRG